MADNKLIWTELRRTLAQRADVSEKDANAFLSALNAAVIEALKTDKQVKINGLGTFKLQAVAPRRSVNVNTGEEFVIDGYNKVAFVPEAGVRELVEKTGVQSTEYRIQTDDAAPKPEIDPLKKLGEQAEEIVGLLGDLGQSPEPEKKPKAPKKTKKPEAGRTETCRSRSGRTEGGRTEGGRTKAGRAEAGRAGGYSKCSECGDYQRNAEARRTEEKMSLLASYVDLLSYSAVAAVGRIFLLP